MPKLAAMGLLGEVDRNALARYCDMWLRWRQAGAMLQKSGEVYPIRNEDGSVKCLMQNPYVAISRALADQLQRLEQSFGMNPSARSRIEVAPRKTDEDDLESFLRIAQ